MMKMKFSCYGIALYLMYVLAVLCTDIIYYVMFLLKVNLPSVISIIITFVIMVMLFLLGEKRCEFEFKDIAIIDYIGIVIIVLLAVPRVFCMDLSYDTANYHITNQYPKFVNYISENIGVGGFQIWSQKLGDRCFFVFRYFLGYRIGTVFNVIISILIYCQLSNLCKMTMIKYFSSSKKINFLSSLMALAGVICHEVLMQWDCYYIDLVAVPLILELIYILCYASFSTIEAYLFAAIGGTALAIKLTSISCVAPCVLMLVIINRRRFSFGSIIKCLLLGIAPDVVYMAYNYTCTSSPLFPYYNEIIKSPYYDLMNFKDQRWGPGNIWETLKWPFHFVFNPEERISEIPMIDGFRYKIAIGIICIASICMLAAFFGGLIQERKSEGICLLWFWGSSYLWAFSTGYARYYVMNVIMMPILGVFSGLYILQIIIHLANVITREKKYDKYLENLQERLVYLLVIIFICGSYVALSSVNNGRTWTWQKSNIDNCMNIYDDRRIETAFLSDERPALILTSYDSHSYASMLQNNVKDNLALLSCTSGFLMNNGEVRQRIMNQIEEYKTNGNIYFMYSSMIEPELEAYSESWLSPFGLELTDERIEVIRWGNIAVSVCRIK